ncbi:MAG: arsenate reductase ArsC [Pseudomonadota bacterium]
MKNILVLCTANSARSILGEALLGFHGAGRVNAFSAGSTPRGTPNPHGIKLLASKGYDVTKFRSKSWDEFDGDGGVSMDIVVTVCDNAAGETCPIWPGAPVQAHWGIPDPHGETDAEWAASFESTYALLEARVMALMALPFEDMKPADLKTALNTIGAMAGSTDLARSYAQ